MNEQEQRPRMVFVQRTAIFEADGRVLLLRRSSNNRHAPHFWEVPGGKVDEGEDLTRSLGRELREETGGLIVAVTHPLVCVYSEIITTGPYKGLPYVVLIGAGQLCGGRLVLSGEHDDYKWVKLDEALKFPLKPEVQMALNIFHSPHFQVLTKP